VAEAAGVSVWTASNTFSNPDRVAEATREAVLHLALEDNAP
jgi:DNA-binding LacI/PurR family transcriptional regulator